MKKVSSCIKKLTEVFDNLNSEPKKIQEFVDSVSKLEHEADLTKNDIRNHLPKSLFLPIDRGQLLLILSIQDSIADKAEEIGNLLTLHPLKKYPELCQNLKKLYEKNIEAFWDTRKIIKEIHELLESSFGGLEAQRVKEYVEQTSFKEHEADRMKHKMMKDFFQKADKIPPPVFYLYVRLLEEVNELSHISEKLANQIRMILELK